MFCSVVTKNSNCEILTKNLFTWFLSGSQVPPKFSINNFAFQRFIKNNFTVDILLGIFSNFQINYFE